MQSFLDSPDGQLVAVYAQLNAPATEYAGDVQAVHEPAPVVGLNVPGEQAVQRIAPAGEDVPAGHTPHTVLVPTTAQPMPALVSGIAADCREKRKRGHGIK